MGLDQFQVLTPYVPLDPPHSFESHIRRMGEPSAFMRPWDREFDFDPHEWRCSGASLGPRPDFYAQKVEGCSKRLLWCQVPRDHDKTVACDVDTSCGRLSAGQIPGRDLAQT